MLQFKVFLSCHVLRKETERRPEHFICFPPRTIRLQQQQQNQLALVCHSSWRLMPWRNLWPRLMGLLPSSLHDWPLPAFGSVWELLLFLHLSCTVFLHQPAQREPTPSKVICVTSSLFLEFLKRFWQNMSHFAPCVAPTRGQYESRRVGVWRDNPEQVVSAESIEPQPCLKRQTYFQCKSYAEHEFSLQQRVKMSVLWWWQTTGSQKQRTILPQKDVGHLNDFWQGTGNVGWWSETTSNSSSH